MHNLLQKAEPIESEMFSFGPKMRRNNKKADRGFPTGLAWHVCRGIGHRKESAITARLDYSMGSEGASFITLSMVA